MSSNCHSAATMDDNDDLITLCTNFKVGSAAAGFCSFSNDKLASNNEYDCYFSIITLSMEMIAFSGFLDFAPYQVDLTANKTVIFEMSYAKLWQFF